MIEELEKLSNKLSEYTKEVVDAVLNLTKKVKDFINTKNSQGDDKLLSLVVDSCDMSMAVLELVRNGQQVAAEILWRSLCERVCKIGFMVSGGKNVVEAYTNHDEIFLRKNIDEIKKIPKDSDKYKTLCKTTLKLLDLKEDKAVSCIYDSDLIKKIGNRSYNDYGWMLMHSAFTNEIRKAKSKQRTISFYDILNVAADFYSVVIQLNDESKEDRIGGIRKLYQISSKKVHGCYSLVKMKDDIIQMHSGNYMVCKFTFRMVEFLYVFLFEWLINVIDKNNYVIHKIFIDATMLKGAEIDNNIQKFRMCLHKFKEKLFEYYKSL